MRAGGVLLCGQALPPFLVQGSLHLLQRAIFGGGRLLCRRGTAAGLLACSLTLLQCRRRFPQPQFNLDARCLGLLQGQHALLLRLAVLRMAFGLLLGRCQRLLQRGLLPLRLAELVCQL